MVEVVIVKNATGVWIDFKESIISEFLTPVVLANKVVFTSVGVFIISNEGHIKVRVRVRATLDDSAFLAVSKMIIICIDGPCNWSFLQSLLNGLKSWAHLDNIVDDGNRSLRAVFASILLGPLFKRIGGLSFKPN